jgi:hypothetical protein
MILSAYINPDARRLRELEPEMSRPQDVFLISSPLQAVVVDALHRSGSVESPENCIYFVADESFGRLFERSRCVFLKDTRLNDRRHIKPNIDVISSHVPGAVRLWVSDIFWPMNNAVYTYFRRSGQLQSINFFDEGIVLYWQENLALLNLVREWFKWKVLTVRLGLPFTCPARSPFYKNPKNGKVFALHANLLARQDMVSPVQLDMARIAKVKTLLDTGTSHTIADNPCFDENAVLFVSQPYHRIDPKEYSSLLHGLNSYLRSIGRNKVYIKMHPSENFDDFNKYYRNLGFEVVYAGMKAPLEVVLQCLPHSCALITFNSSVLLNARKFGFTGEIISYGLDWIAKRYPLYRNLYSLNSSLFVSAGVSIVRHLR